MIDHKKLNGGRYEKDIARLVSSEPFAIVEQETHRIGATRLAFTIFATEEEIAALTETLTQAGLQNVPLLQPFFTKLEELNNVSPKSNR